MSSVTFSPAAIADIGGIWDYTAETWGVDQADRYTGDQQSFCSTLIVSPG
jgi:toxin ParE1/3/4